MSAEMIHDPLGPEPAPEPVPEPAFDPLAALERVALAEEIVSVVRHDLRNHFTSVRNASFYLQRRARGSEMWSADPRVAQFFDLIDEAMVTSTAVLEQRLSLDHLFSRQVRCVAGGPCVQQAAALARGAAPRQVAVAAGDGVIEADPLEVALAVRCLIENAVEAAGAARVTAEAAEGWYVIAVADEGPGLGAEERSLAFEALRSTKPGHAGLGLNIATRVARRYRGTLSLEAAAVGTVARMSLPLAREGRR